MRLSKEYKKVIKTTLLKNFGKGSKFYLFGSRADDSKRGGDIDLYIETGFAETDKAIDAKWKTHRELMKQLGEQKIDIIVHGEGEEFTPIEEIAKETGVRL